jgi:GNAT superfamily N-acetyltransferase
MNLTVRRATVADVDSIVNLRIMLLREVGEIKGEEEVTKVADANRKYFADALPTGDFVAWIAEVDGKTVASSGLVLFRRPPYLENLSGVEAYIMNMYTMPQWRGKGLAKALLEQLILFAKASKVRRIWLHATEVGRPLYKKFGFNPKFSEMELIL